VSDASFRIVAPPPANRLVVSDAEGVQGQTVEIEVILESTAAAVGSFGVDLVYETDALRYVAGSAECGELTTNWIQCSAVENVPGVVTIGGFGVEPIAAGQSGSIAQLSFEVICVGCADGDESTLQPTNLQDGVAGMTIVAGTFTYDQVCVSDGDVDGNGRLSPGDAACAFNTFLTGGSLSSECDVDGFDCEMVAADVNCNGTVTPSDALAIFERWLGGDGPEPCFAESATPPPSAMGTVSRGPAIAGTVAGANQEDHGLYLVDLSEMRSSRNGRVTVPVMMSARRGRAALGFELAFDPATVRFSGLDIAPAGLAWETFEASEVEPGRLIVGGFDAEGLEAVDIAAAGDDGTVQIATLEFERTSDTPIFGAVEWTDQVLGSGEAGPIAGSPSASRLALGQPFPNPLLLGQQVRINLSLPEGATHDVQAAIYDVQGRLVRSLVRGHMPGGAHVIAWDRTADNATSVGSGIYFLHLRAGNIVENRKIVVVVE
jgi:hypothetical protein